jgi:DNA-binding GntR family transcriptional regulator
LQLRVRDRIGSSYAEHEAVVKAIIAGDSEQTSELLRDHIMVQGQRFADLIASLGQLASQAA